MKDELNWLRVYAVAKKEVFHILRDPFTLILALIWPVAVVLVFGLAMDFNIKNIPLSVTDHDRTQASRELLDAFDSSNYFLLRQSESPGIAMRDIGGERARSALIIPPKFQSDLLSGRGATVQMLLDGSDNSTIGAMMSYIGSIQRIGSRKITGIDARSPIEIRTRFLFNPELNSRWFTVPGLAVVVMAILSILLTSLTVAREWENGSMELLLTTPVQPIEIILGKLTPYGLLGLGAVALVYAMARGIFDVPFVGSHLIFLAGCLLFLGTYLAQGLLISVTTRNQQLAMQFAIMSGLLPAQLLSGFVFPIESMPKFFQYLTALMPARWFMVITRAEFLEGSGLTGLLVPFIALGLINTVMVGLSSKKFKKDLEA